MTRFQDIRMLATVVAIGLPSTACSFDAIDESSPVASTTTAVVADGAEAAYAEPPTATEPSTPVTPTEPAAPAKPADPPPPAKCKWTNPPNGTFTGIVSVPVSFSLPIYGEVTGNQDLRVTIGTVSTDPPTYTMKAEFDAGLAWIEIANVTVTLNCDGTATAKGSSVIRAIDDKAGGTVFNGAGGIGFGGSLPGIGDRTIIFGANGALIIYSGSGDNRGGVLVKGGLEKK